MELDKLKSRTLETTELHDIGEGKNYTKTYILSYYGMAMFKYSLTNVDYIDIENKVTTTNTLYCINQLKERNNQIRQKLVDNMMILLFKKLYGDDADVPLKGTPIKNMVNEKLKNKDKIKYPMNFISLMNEDAFIEHRWIAFLKKQKSDLKFPYKFDINEIIENDSSGKPTPKSVLEKNEYLALRDGFFYNTNYLQRP